MKATIKNGDLRKALSYHLQFDITDRLILLGYRGSIVHGTVIPSQEIDDKDVMGVVIPPKEYYLGLDRFENYEKLEGCWDVVVYSLQKMVRLLLKNNPNVMSLLWLPDKHYIYKDYYGQQLIDNRSLFVSRLAYKSFCGYAHGQLHRMTHGAHEGYMGEKRKELVERFGYDTKNASHLIRILKMGIDFLVTGELVVDREEKHQLIEIKKGLWSLERVQGWADTLFDSLEKAYINCKLPAKPDRKAVNELLVEMTEERLEDPR